MRELQRVLFRLHRFALRRPRSVLLAFASMIAVAATQLPAMQVRLAITDVEHSFPSAEWNRALREDFGGGNAAFLILRPPGESRFTRDDLTAIRSWLDRERKDNAELVGAVSPFVVGPLRWEWGQPKLVPLLANDDPQELSALRSTPWHGILTDTTDTDVGIELVLRDTPGGSRYGEFDPAVVGAVWESVQREVVAGRSLEVHLTGPATFLYHSLQGIERFRVLNVAVLVVLLLLCRLLLGTWRSGGLLIGSLAAAGIVVYAAMSVAHAPIDFLSTGLFLMISVAALSDYLFLSHEQLRGSHWRRAFRRMLLPGFFTSLTTIIGFGSLAVSDLEIVRRFGVWAAFGAAAEWIVTFVLLPAFLTLFHPEGSWTDRNRAWRASLPERWVRWRPPRGLVLILLSVYGFAVGAVWGVNTSDSLVRLFPEGHPYRSAFSCLASSRGWTGSLSLVFADAADREGNEAILARVGSLPNVGRVLDPWAVLDFLVNGALDESTELLEREGEVPEAFRAFFAEDQARAVLYLRALDLDALTKTLRQIETIGGERCHAAGELVAYAEFAERVPAALFRTFAVCLTLTAIGVTGLFLANGNRRPLPVLVGVFWGPAFMMGAIWVLQVPVNFLTCVFASVLVGLTGDNAIQYLFAGRGHGLAVGIGRRGGASIQVAFVMALVCLVFLGSAFVPSRILGTLLGAGFLASLIGDLWILQELTGERVESDVRPAART